MESCRSSWIVQKYIHPPALLKGQKLSLVVLLLVRSLDPLDAYVYRHFYARVAPKKYTLEAKSLGDAEVHLTDMVQQDDWTGVSVG